MNEYQPFDADNRLVIIDECRSSQTIYVDSEESFNAETEQAAMNKVSWSICGALTNHSTRQTTFADCAGDGTCGSHALHPHDRVAGR